MEISEKIRGVIRCRKILETVRSGRRSFDGRQSKIEEKISEGICGIAAMTVFLAWIY